MANISFETAQSMTIKSADWLKKLSNYIENPANPVPQDVYSTQKFAFEISKDDLEAVMVSDRVVGILGYESDSESLTVILVSVDAEGKPKSTVTPRQTWPLLYTPDKVSDVINTFLKP